MPRVIGLVGDFKVGDFVVILDLIPVMNNLMGLQLPPYVLLHDLAMCPDAFPASVGIYVDIKQVSVTAFIWSIFYHSTTSAYARGLEPPTTRLLKRALYQIELRKQNQTIAGEPSIV